MRTMLRLLGILFMFWDRLIKYNTTTTLTKKLTIIGPGYYLDAILDTQFNKLTSL
jgi:hypothetical protein